MSDEWIRVDTETSDGEPYRIKIVREAGDGPNWESYRKGIKILEARLNDDEDSIWHLKHLAQRVADDPVEAVECLNSLLNVAQVLVFMTPYDKAAVTMLRSAAEGTAAGE